MQTEKKEGVGEGGGGVSAEGKGEKLEMVPEEEREDKGQGM